MVLIAEFHWFHVFEEVKILRKNQHGAFPALTSTSLCDDALARAPGTMKKFQHSFLTSEVQHPLIVHNTFSSRTNSIHNLDLRLLTAQ